jgi:hypothetical protein
MMTIDWITARFIIKDRDRRTKLYNCATIAHFRTVSDRTAMESLGHLFLFALAAFAAVFPVAFGQLNTGCLLSTEPSVDSEYYQCDLLIPREEEDVAREGDLDLVCDPQLSNNNGLECQWVLPDDRICKVSSIKVAKYPIT